MGISARLASSKLALFPHSGTTSRTADSEYLFGAEFLHARSCPNPIIRNGQF